MAPPYIEIEGRPECPQDPPPPGQEDRPTTNRRPRQSLLLIELMGSKAPAGTLSNMFHDKSIDKMDNIIRDIVDDAMRACL